VTVETPDGLGDRGRKLWADITELHELDPVQAVTLVEACRTADRLEQLDQIIAGKGVLRLLHFRHMVERDSDDERHLVMTVDGVLSEVRQQQTVLKQLLAALRLPDGVSGKRPQQRGGARGAYTPGGKAGSVSSLDRARAAKSGA
jgi:hypothetical protein